MKEFEIENIRSMNAVELKETNGGVVPLFAYFFFAAWGFILGALIEATT